MSRRTVNLLALAVAVVATVLLIYYGAQSIFSPAKAPVATATVPLTTRTATSAVVVSTPAPVSTVSSTTTFSGQTQVVVTGTDGDGALLRSEPGGPGIIRGWHDGSVLTVVGADRVANGITWKNVRDEDGSVGWMAAQYLKPR